jgi:glycosyltransferase involved in cell wall biosynthesis
MTGNRVVRVGMLPTPMDLYRSVRLQVGFRHRDAANPASSEAEPSKTPGILRTHGRALLEIPDPYWGWYVPATRMACHLMVAERVAAVFSSVPPYTAHLVARFLRKRFDVPWLADFRDPWTHNPRSEAFPSWRCWIDRQLESSCLRWADRIICNTDRLRATFERFHPDLAAHKLVTLTNGFDESLPGASTADTRGGRRLLLHLGSLYGGRRIDTFCQALSLLINQGRLDPATFRVLFVGYNDGRAAIGSASDLMEKGCVEFRSRVSWQIADQIRWNADLLLIFFADPLAVPAKFYEYLPTGKPIFAVTPHGALTDMIEKTGAGVCVEPDNPTEIAAKLLEALARPSVPPEQVQQRWSDEFHFRSLAGRLASWVKDLTKRTSEVRK